ncbi:MAG: complex I subunit 1 family protein [Planctomycetota bacterium]
MLEFLKAVWNDGLSVAAPDLDVGQLFVSVHVLIIMVHAILFGVAYLIYWERKISAYIQDRLGPNRTGFDFGLPILGFLKGMWGLGQPLADGAKFLLKEDYMPPNADRWLFSLAPVAIIIPALIGFAVIPWGGTWIVPEVDLFGLINTTNLPLVGDITGEVLVTGAPINVGVAYLVAVGSLGVYGVTLGGWAGNNKYSFLGGLRATAQMISYELPMGLALLTVILTVGSILPNDIVNFQVENGVWMILSHPLVAMIFFTCVLAESNRAPFDNAEAEQELVGGYHTEYSSMRFAMFFLAEYAHMITGAAFFTLLFLGGWSLPVPFFELPMVSEGLAGVLIMLLKVGIFFGKAYLVCIFMMVVRWTLPRIRYDQIMFLGWQTLIPLTLAIVVATSVLVFFQWTAWWQTLLMNAGFALGMVVLATTLPARKANRRVRLYGSRYFPVEGTPAFAQSADPMALEDRPVEGTVSTA